MRADRDELLVELEDALACMREHGARIRELDRELQPYWVRKRELAMLLTQTHHWLNGAELLYNTGIDESQSYIEAGRCYVTGFRRETAGERKNLFAELDRLAEVFGPTVELRRIAAIEAAIAQRVADNIRKLLTKPNRPFQPPKSPRPGRQSGPATDDLFAWKKAS